MTQLEAACYILWCIVCVFCPGTRPDPYRHISSLSWQVAGIHPSPPLTVWVLCRPGPSSCHTDPIIPKPVLWVTPLTLHVSLPLWKPADTSYGGKVRWQLIKSNSIFLMFSSSEWIRPNVGGGLAAASRGPSARCWAPDRTELLPWQVIGARDATAQDTSTDCLELLDECPKEALLDCTVHQLADLQWI